MRRIIGLFLAGSVGLVALPARTLVSQATPDPRQDILNYQLTLPKANSLITAMDAMTRYVVSLPDWQARMAAAKKMTPAERREKMEKDPKAMAILKANNLTTDEYLVGVPALRLALRAAQGGPSGSVSAANLAFAKANLAELKPKMDAADGIKP